MSSPEPGEAHEPGEPVANAPLPESLPPVSPPSSSFFLQLFVLPALIVMGIVTVWFLFGKLAGGERSVDEYVEVLRSGAKNRWQAAHDLTHLLRRDSRFADDRELALKLSNELRLSLESGGANPDAETIRYQEYLCGAVASFSVPVGVDTLRQAAKPDRHFLVRRAGLFGLARLADRVGDLGDPNVLLETREYLTDDDEKVRELSAFTLGFLADERARPALTAALNDPVASVRYNAANALANLGDPAALPVLLDMLDEKQLGKQFLVQDDLTAKEYVDEQLVSWTVFSALRSLGKLQTQQAQVDWSTVIPRLEAMAGDSNYRYRAEAGALLAKLRSENG